MVYTVEPTSDRVRAFALAKEEAGPSCVTDEALVAHVNSEKYLQDRVKLEQEKWIRWWTQSSTTVWDTEYISPRGDEEVLMRHCRIVTDTWRNFSRKSSVNRALKASGLADLDRSTPPTIDSLQYIVETLKEKKDASNQTLWGKIRSNMIGFAAKMDAHKQCFSIFPNESIYTSVLAGVVSSIVVACTKYEKICERFTRGFLTIADDMAFITDSAESLDTPRIRKTIVAAYAEVFKFLCSAMGWLASRRRRISASMESEFSEEQVGGYLAEIKGLADSVEKQLILDTHKFVDTGKVARSHNTPAQQKSANVRFRRKDDAQKEESFDVASKSFARIGNEITRYLIASEEQHDYEFVVHVRRSRSADAPRELQGEPTEGPTNLQHLVAPEHTRVQCDEESEICTDDESSESVDADACNGPLVHYYARKEIEDLSQSLNSYVDNGVSQLLRMDLQDDMHPLPSEVLNDIQDWLQKKESSFLWVEGPSAPSDLSPTALRVWAVTSNAMIPCICFFSQEKFSQSKELDYEEAGVICLLYTLINQLVHYLPSEIPSDQALDDKYFSRLDGTWQSTTLALDAIRYFLSHSPSSIVIVFHGLEDIEGKGTRRLLKDLIGIIREQSTRTVVKVLFTTNGMSHVLGEKTEVCEQVDASRMSQAGPGRLLRGASSLGDLELERSVV